MPHLPEVYRRKHGYVTRCEGCVVAGATPFLLQKTLPFSWVGNHDYLTDTWPSPASSGFSITELAGAVLACSYHRGGEGRGGPRLPSASAHTIFSLRLRSEHYGQSPLLFAHTISHPKQ